MITIKNQEEAHNHIERLGKAGVQRPQLILGPKVELWRKFRDGHEALETLPELIAEWTLLTIYEREPNVERAKIIR